MVQQLLGAIIAAFMQPFARPSDPDPGYANALRRGNLQQLRRLLVMEPDGGRFISILGRQTTPLHLACEVGDDAAVRRFIAHQVDVNIQRSDGCTPVYIASVNGHHSLLDSLARAQADVDIQKKHTSPLYVASQAGLEHIVELLIKAQADINSKTELGESPLYIAAQNNFDRIARALIRARADVNIQRNSGESPLYMAC